MEQAEPRITTIAEIKLVGISRKMSFAGNQTAGLWKSFMPRLREISNRQANSLYSLQWYGKDFNFGLATPFEKWALVPVSDFSSVPEGMEPYTIPAGTYAVFTYRGPAGNPAIFHYIFSQWLPDSGYSLDDRPHFEVLGPRYKNRGPDSEEAIWIPVRPCRGPNNG